MTVLACIVEGDGDKAALPLLIRRICHEVATPQLVIPPPIRVRRDNFLRRGVEADNYRARYLSLAAGKAGSTGRVLVLMDADADCPAELARVWFPEIARLAAPTPIALVFAKTEFEAWFIAGADALGAAGGLDLHVPPDPETIRGAKEWVRKHLRQGRAYSETVDQPRFASRLDWQRARGRSPSLDKLCRDLARLLDIPQLMI